MLKIFESMTTKSLPDEAHILVRYQARYRLLKEHVLPLCSETTLYWQTQWAWIVQAFSPPHNDLAGAFSSRSRKVVRICCQVHDFGQQLKDLKEPSSVSLNRSASTTSLQRETCTADVCRLIVVNIFQEAYMCSINECDLNVVFRAPDKVWRKDDDDFISHSRAFCMPLRPFSEIMLPLVSSSAPPFQFDSKTIHRLPFTIFIRI